MQILHGTLYWDVAQRQCEKLLTSRLLVRIQSSQLEVITLYGRDPNGEDADLKSVGCKNFAGSTPVSSVGGR